MRYIHFSNMYCSINVEFSQYVERKWVRPCVGVTSFIWINKYAFSVYIWKKIESRLSILTPTSDINWQLDSGHFWYTKIDTVFHSGAFIFLREFTSKCFSFLSHHGCIFLRPTKMHCENRICHHVVSQSHFKSEIVTWQCGWTCLYKARQWRE